MKKQDTMTKEHAQLKNQIEIWKQKINCSTKYSFINNHLKCK